jgi:hypothetical protein
MVYKMTTRDMGSTFNFRGSRSFRSQVIKKYSFKTVKYACTILKNNSFYLIERDQIVAAVKLGRARAFMRRHHFEGDLAKFNTDSNFVPTKRVYVGRSARD